MAHDFLLLQDRLVVLAVFAGRVSVGAAPRLLHKIFRGAEILLVPCDLIEFGQRHLHDGMARGHVFLSFLRSEHLAHQVGVLDGNVQQRAFPRGAVVGHGGLVEVPGVVEFVAVDFFPSVRAPPAGEPRAFVGHARGQVAVRFLRRCDEGDDAVQIGVQLCVVFHGERVRRPFNDFIRVGVVEREVAPVFSFL